MPDTAYNYCLTLDQFRQSQRVQGATVSANSLDEGQVMVHVDKVALTANSISYVIAGKSGLMPFLDVFPAQEGLANIPCWGYGDVLFSKHPNIPEGERLYGFFPVASHIICTPGKVGNNGFTDAAPGRDAVAPFYSEYVYATREPGYAPAFEETIMLFRPLFGTSFLLQSYCEDNDFYGADRVVVSSASAKTAMGFGYLLRKLHGARVHSVGLTSQRNRAFVAGLDCFDEVLTYEEVAQLKPEGRSLFFDVAGNREVLTQVHHQLGDTIAYSGQVGQTHWDSTDAGEPTALPGPPPAF